MKGATVTSGHGPLGFDDSVGVEPVRLHDCVSVTLQQAKPMAGTIFKARPRAWCSMAALGHGPQTGVKAQKPIQTHADLPLILCNHASCRAARSTRRKSIGAGGWTNRHVGPIDPR
jgi:hypothetical protein